MKKYLLLCGGVGGAKLALGFKNTVNAENLGIAVNTGDDFTHLNLKICPDLDTVMYTLAGESDVSKGWGTVVAFTKRGDFFRHFRTSSLPPLHSFRRAVQDGPILGSVRQFGTPKCMYFQ